MMEKMEMIEDRVNKNFELDISTKVKDVIELSKREMAG